MEEWQFTYVTCMIEIVARRWWRPERQYVNHSIFRTFKSNETDGPTFPPPETPPAPELTRVMEIMRSKNPPLDASWEERRAALRAATERFEVAEGYRIEEGTLAGWPVETVGTPEQLARPQRIMHLHGGGYIMGSPATARPIAAGLAVATDTAVVALDYPLAPEAPFPAALNAAIDAYLALGEQFDPATTILSGDSAGGGLAIAVAMQLRDTDQAMPAALVGQSAWLDVSLSGGEPDAAQLSDPQAGPEILARMSEAYIQGGDPKAPLASPLFGDLTGLPPILAQWGTHDFLRVDAPRLYEAAKKQNVDVTIQIFTGMFHVWHALAPRLEAANTAFSQIAAWLSERGIIAGSGGRD